MSRFPVVPVVIGACVLAVEQRPAAVIVINGGIFGSLEIAAPGEGWAYVDPSPTLATCIPSIGEKP